MTLNIIFSVALLLSDIIIKLCDHIRWGWEYVMQGARITFRGCLLICTFN